MNKCTCKCLYFLWRAAIISPSSVHAVTSSSSIGNVSFSITRLWYRPAVKGLKAVTVISYNNSLEGTWLPLLLKHVFLFNTQVLNYCGLRILDYVQTHLNVHVSNPHIAIETWRTNTSTSDCRKTCSNQQPLTYAYSFQLGHKMKCFLRNIRYMWLSSSISC